MITLSLSLVTGEADKYRNRPTGLMIATSPRKNLTYRVKSNFVSFQCRELTGKQ